MKKREEQFPPWPGEKPETHEDRKSETGTPNNVSKTRQNLADMFVASLSENQLPWNQPWVSSIPPMARLRNAVSEKPYQGVNKIFLWLIALNKHYEDPRWCTFRQATEKGWKIRKGEHGYPVEYWMMYDVIEKKYYSFDEAARIVHENEDKQGDFRPRCKTYVVFNAAQIEGIPELNAAVALPSGPEYTNKVADEFFRTYLRNENIKLDTGASAYYTHGFDMIVLPPKKDFVSEEAYYDTAFHEAVHSTQGPDRTSRTVKYEEKSGRAMEELIAEIGCAFIMLAVFGDVGSDVRENNIAYVQSWSEGIKKDPNMLARAIKLADEGANYVIEHAKLEALNDTHKDDVITFEELGIDRLFVDEAHDYKNLFAKTKMQNIGGISTSEAHRSSDLYTKTRYLQEKGCSVVLATGTPLSNSIVEMFTWMRYLGADSLRQRGWENLDAWIGQFAEVTTEYELAPEGTGYRTQTRVRKFFNLPELMTLFREFGDIKTAEMLDLGTPEAVRSTIHVPPTDEQIDMVAELGDRADAVHAGSVAPTEDNMLKITSDGRKIALDPRLMDPSLPEPENSKVSYCAEKVYEIWEKTKDQKSTQFVFCDLGTPNGSTASTAQTGRAPDGDPALLNQSFSNVYAELKDKLVRLGIPADEIAFIHDAKNDVQLTELKNKFSAGLIRVLVGSTKKLGTGTNVQEKVIAMHHLDSPYRPSDLEQREGRGIRRGNENSKVEIYTYVTEKTFDAYLFQMLERKQNFIGQIYRYSVTRECEDIDPRALNFAELKALCAGNPLVREKMELDIRVQRLKLEESAYLDKKFALQDQITSSLPWTIERTKCKISEITKDIASVTEYQNGPDGKKFSITLMGRQFTEQRKATAKLEEIFKGWKGEKELEIGSYLGMALFLSADKLSAQLLLRGESTYSTSRQSSMSYLLRNIKGIPVQMRELLEQTKRELAEHENQLAIAKEEVNAPFIHAEELAAALDRQSELNAILSDDGPSERNDEERDTDLEPQQDTDTPIHGDAVKKYVAMARQILSRESPETRSNDDVNIDL